MGRELDRLLDRLLDMLEGSEDPDEIAAAAEEVYDQAIKKCRPIIGLVPRLIRKIVPDIQPAVVGLLGATIQFQEDEEVQAMLSASAKLRAAHRKERLDQYEDAGFTREEAMALLLEDIANRKATAKQFSSSIRSSSSGSRRS